MANISLYEGGASRPLLGGRGPAARLEGGVERVSAPLARSPRSALGTNRTGPHVPACLLVCPAVTPLAFPRACALLAPWPSSPQNVLRRSRSSFCHPHRLAVLIQPSRLYAALGTALFKSVFHCFRLFVSICSSGNTRSPYSVTSEQRLWWKDWKWGRMTYPEGSASIQAPGTPLRWAPGSHHWKRAGGAEGLRTKRAGSRLQPAALCSGGRGGERADRQAL